MKADPTAKQAERARKAEEKAQMKQAEAERKATERNKAREAVRLARANLHEAQKKEKAAARAERRLAREAKRKADREEEKARNRELRAVARVEKQRLDAESRAAARLAREEESAERTRMIADRKANTKIEGARRRKAYAVILNDAGLSSPHTTSIRGKVLQYLRTNYKVGEEVPIEVLAKKCEKILYGASVRSFLSKLEELGHIDFAQNHSQDA